MSLLGLFSASVHGMTSQSDAMNAIAGNIANLKTGGYKRTDVHFATVLSQSVSNSGHGGAAASGSSHADFGGAVANRYARVTTMGEIESSGGALDLAIGGGQGLFVVQTELGGGGETLFTRDGSFATGIGPDTTIAGIGGTPVTTQEGYVVDKNGFYLQGWDYDPTGSYAGGLGSLGAMRIDGDAFAGVSAPTTEASLSLNLPASGGGGGGGGGDADTVYRYPIHGVDSTGSAWSLETRFIKDTTANTWQFDVAAPGAPGDSIALSPPADFARTTAAGEQLLFNSAAGTVTMHAAGGPAANVFAGLSPGDAITVSGTALNNGTYTILSVAPDGASAAVDPATPIAADETTAAPATVAATGVLGAPLAFNPDGTLSSNGQYTVAVAHAGGSASTFSLDLAAITQFAGDFLGGDYNQDGFAASDLAEVTFDELGHVIGRFESGLTRNLYRVALADFVNADGLTSRDGNVFAASADSGAVRVGVAGSDGLPTLRPGARELSNVDLADEFSKMIQTQTVYNASATSLRTQDEMLQKLDQL